MNRFLALLALPVLGLVACAPSVTDTAGRLVNTATGQEGRVLFLGGFQARPATPGMPDTVTVQLGQDLYSGQYSVIGDAAPVAVSARFGFGGGSDLFGRRGYDGGLSTSLASRTASLHPGNLIVKTLKLNNAAVKTLTCNFQADGGGHGVGDCLGSDGAKYALQF